MFPFPYPTDYSGKAYALVTAAAKGDEAGVLSCIEAGADVTFGSNLALRAAAFTGNLGTLVILAGRGADVHAENDEALLYAGKRRDGGMVKFLLEKGADPEKVAQHHAAAIDDAYRETMEELHSDRLIDDFRERTAVLKNNPPSGKFRPRKPF